MRRIAICLLIALSFIWFGACQRCFAQTIIGRPMKPPSVNYFPSDAGIRFRWVASDLSSSPVSSWTDRITGSVMTQATGGNQPTWSASNGVIFDGSDDFLTITNFTAGVTLDNWGVLVVLKFNSTAAHQMVLGNEVAAQIYLGITVANTLYEGNTLNHPFTTTTLCDFFAVNTTNALTSYRSYTNGVQMSFQNANPWNGGYAWPRLGRGNGNAPFGGNVREIIVWTNYIWTASQIARVHSYATDTYGVSP